MCVLLSRHGLSIRVVLISPSLLQPGETMWKLKPIFHWKWGSRWPPNMNEIYTKKRNVHGQRQNFAFGTQRNLYSTDLVFGFRVGWNANFRFHVGGNANFMAPRYQHVGIPNAKFWHWGYCPTPNPDTRDFASQRNIGLRVTKTELTFKLQSLARTFSPSSFI